MTDKVECSVTFTHNATQYTLHPSELNVDRVITEGLSVADLKCYYPKTSVPYVNDDIKIWLSRATETNYNTVFTGKIIELEKESEGLQPRWLNLECKDYGKYLMDRNWRGETIDTIDKVIKGIVKSLVDQGLITTNNVTSSQTTIKLKSTGESMWDCVKRACTEGKVDWDFYMDFQRDLHAHPRGIYSSGLNVAEDALSAVYKESVDRLITKQEVWGTLGGHPFQEEQDSFFTESISNWGTNPGAEVILDDEDERIGNNAIMSEAENGNVEIYLERTMPVYPILDLFPGGELKTYIGFLSETTSGKEDIDLTIYYYTDTSNYFHKSYKIAGGRSKRKAKGKYGTFFPEKTVYNLPLTQKTFLFGILEEFGIEGNPDWRDIGKIRFEINSHVSPVNNKMYLWIDGMSITTHYYGDWNVSNTSPYGTIEGRPILNSEFPNDEACTLAASLIVSAYSLPLVTVENVRTLKNFEIDLGEEAYFNTLDINTTVTVRKIRHEVSHGELHTYLDLAERYLPEPERMISILKNQLEKLNYNFEAWRLKIVEAELIALRTGVLDWWEMDSLSAILGYTNSKLFSFIGDFAGGEDKSRWAEYRSCANDDWEFLLGGVRLWTCDSGPHGIRIHRGGIMSKIPYTNTISTFTEFKITSDLDGQGIISIGNPYVTNQYGFGVRFYKGTLFAFSEQQPLEVTPTTSDINYIKLTDLVTDTWYTVESIYYPNDRVEFFLDKEFKGTVKAELAQADFSQYYTFSCWTFGAKQTLVVKAFQVGEY